MNSTSGFLYAEPSVAEGIARLIDLGGTLVEYNVSHEPDQIAIRADWRAIGADLRTVIRQETTRQLSLFDGDES